MVDAGAANSMTAAASDRAKLRMGDLLWPANGAAVRRFRITKKAPGRRSGAGALRKVVYPCWVAISAGGRRGKTPQGAVSPRRSKSRSTGRPAFGPFRKPLVLAAGFINDPSSESNAWSALEAGEVGVTGRFAIARCAESTLRRF